MDTTITITVVVKGSADRAAQEVVARMNAWFCEDTNREPMPGHGYEDGSLLYWRQGTARDPQPF